MARQRVLIACCSVLCAFGAPAQNTAPAPAPPKAIPVKPLPKATSEKSSEKAATESAPKEKEPSVTFNWIHNDGNYIALTFDDGPSDKLTPKLLQLLAAHHIHATFFVLGENVAQYPDIVARAAKEGHEIASHSWSHPNFFKLSDDALRSQLRRTDDAIKQATGQRPTLMRPPYGNITSKQKHWVHDEFGYKIIMWDVDPLDWKRPGPTVVSNRILKETRSGSIVLSHDIHPGTIEAMPATLDELAAKGFKFVTVSELISLATPEPPKATPAPKTTSAASPAKAPATAPGN